MAAPQDDDPRDPHGLAVDIQTDLQKLATMLAHAGAAPAAVSQLTRMAQVISQVVKVLGQGPIDQAGGPPPPGQEPPQQQPPPGPPPPAAPQAPAAQPPGPPQQAQLQHHTMHSAAHALHAMMQASAAQRNGQ